MLWGVNVARHHSCIWRQKKDQTAVPSRWLKQILRSSYREGHTADTCRSQSAALVGLYQQYFSLLVGKTWFRSSFTLSWHHFSQFRNTCYEPLTSTSNKHWQVSCTQKHYDMFTTGCCPAVTDTRNRLVLSELLSLSALQWTQEHDARTVPLDKLPIDQQESQSLSLLHTQSVLCSSFFGNFSSYAEKSAFGVIKSPS